MSPAAIVWLLIAIGGSNSSPTLIERFSEERECRVAAMQLYAASKASNGPYIYGHCIPVRQNKLVKP